MTILGTFGDKKGAHCEPLIWLTLPFPSGILFTAHIWGVAFAALLALLIPVTVIRRWLLGLISFFLGFPGFAFWHWNLLFNFVRGDLRTVMRVWWTVLNGES